MAVHHKLGYGKPDELVLHLPLRYEDETRLTPLGEMRIGQPAQVEATVIQAEVQFRPRRQLVVQLESPSSLHTQGEGNKQALYVRFLHFYPSQAAQLKPGVCLRLYGEVRDGFFGAEMVHPRYRVIKPGAPLPDTLTPIYPTVAGLGQAKLAQAVHAAIAEADLGDSLPPGLLQAADLWPFERAIRHLHAPPPGASLAELELRQHPAWRRLKLDELLAQQLSLRLHAEAREALTAIPLEDVALAGRLEATLPFPLTGAQKRVLAEIRADLARGHPMHRLLQGDVGSGKTCVAALAALTAVGSSYQAAVMAPTEILAEQLYLKFREWLEPLGVQVVWLAAALKGKAKRQALEVIADGRAQVAVGTHALFQTSVAFNNLALAIVDEQHRFGVEQRLALRQKGTHLPSPTGGGAGGEGAALASTGSASKIETPFPHPNPLPEGEGEKHYIPLPEETLEFARKLRAEQTDAEKLVWYLIRNRRLANAKFQRQKPIGPYVLDFYCHEAKLAIELDGGQHSEQKNHDGKRDAFLKSKGIKVLRYWNNQVLAETESVLEAIWQELTTVPSPCPLPEGEGATFPSPPGGGVRGEGTAVDIAKVAPSPPTEGGASLPHLLMMSATPIPRSLAMSYYADLDVSVIDELPPGRKPIATKVVGNARRDEVIGRLRDYCSTGAQAYWVCPLIEESEKVDLKAALDAHAELTTALPELRIGLVHGRLKAEEKAAAMAAFKAHETDVLVATTVIEVGVDVPNAGLMVIEHAERMGLAQLHQLRGRVGRGSRESACLLIYADPLSDNARQRLRVIKENTDGFAIAREDLRLRGPGEFMGARQSGAAMLRFADLEADQDLLELARDMAGKLLRHHPESVEKHLDRWLPQGRDFLRA